MSITSTLVNKMENSTLLGSTGPASVAYTYSNEFHLDSNATFGNITTSEDPGYHLQRSTPAFISPPLKPADIITIPLYSLIFILAVIGNLLVIVTLIQNKRMRTVTNVFLLNLSISDLLVAVFCMPFTIIPILLQNFIFGEFICVSIRYLQGNVFGFYLVVTIFNEKAYSAFMSSIRPSIYFSSIVISRSNMCLEPTSTKQ